MTSPVSGNLPPNASISLPQRILSRLSLRSGDTVSVRVIQPLAGGRWQISLVGKLVAARVDIPVAAGMELRARLLRDVSGRLILQVIEEGTSPHVFSRLGLSSTPEIELIVAAMIRSGMPIQSEQVGLLARTLAKLTLRDAAVSRIVAMLHDRGLRLTASQIEELVEIIAGTGGGPSHSAFSGGGGSGTFDPGSRRRNEESRNPKEDSEEPLPLTRRIGDMARAFAEGAQSVDGSLLQLFNHVPAGHDHWVVIPYGYTADEQSVSGSMRVHLESSSTGVKADRYSLSAVMDGAAWVFLWYPSEASSAIQVYTDESLRPEDVADLENAFSRCGLEMDGGVRALSSTDGFSDLPADGLVRGVERSV